MAAKILIAEDESEILSTITLWLEKAGYQVTTAADGAEAFQKVQSDPPNLVLMDVVLPQLNGWEVCQRLKRDPSLKHIPVILLSGLIAEAYGHDELDLADAHLPKPLRAEMLLAKISEMLKNSNS